MCEQAFLSRLSSCGNVDELKDKIHRLTHPSPICPGVLSYYK